MQPFQGPITILILKHTILLGEITQISHGAKTIMITQGQITSNILIIITILSIINPITIIILPIINKIFLTMLHKLFFQNRPLEKRMTDFEKTMERYMRNQESFIQTLQNNNAQAIIRLDVQMS